jgi:hypothetical protein
MARNEEKALTLFSKWSTFKTDYHSGKACAAEITVDYKSLRKSLHYEDIVQRITS